MSGDDNQRRILIKGIVVPVDWDQAGEVQKIGVLTDDEGEYEVEPDGICDQLMIHLRSEILADAVLLDSVRSVNRVRIVSFAILDWNDSEDWIASRRS
jgi:hypothetical protein